MLCRGRVDQVDQIGERLLAIRVEMDAVAGRWRREAVASQQTFANGRPAVRRAWRFRLKLDLGFGGGDGAQLSAAEQQIERQADGWRQHNRQNPGDGAAG